MSVQNPVRRPTILIGHSPHSSIKVKNAWCYTSTRPYVFTACFLRTWTIYQHVLKLPIGYPFECLASSCHRHILRPITKTIASPGMRTVDTRNSVTRHAHCGHTKYLHERAGRSQQNARVCWSSSVNLSKIRGL
jgi:hypothetical protein